MSDAAPGSVPTVALIATGGTIGSHARHRRDQVDYSDFAPKIAAEDLLARVPEIGEIANVRNVPYRLMSSTLMVPEDWADLGRKALEAIEQGAHGVVITHGTNTIEDTAYFLHLTVPTDQPIVVTGSMRPTASMSADGESNLYKSMLLAGSPRAVGVGAMVCLNDAISSARDVSKTRAYRVETFQNQDFGYLGYVDNDDEVLFYRRPTRRHTRQSEFDVRTLEGFPRVDIVTSYPGADGVMIDALVAAGARGIVIAGVGAGKITTGEHDAAQRALAAGVPTVISARVGIGRIIRTTWNRQYRYVAGDTLSPQKARVLLMLGLTKTSDPDELQRMFDEY
ncbi:MAG: asparaginase [Chloroflexi bacterium]|nr:asparaginase [Chloroflexota bacterium]